jgi:uroporphyrin-III C-methyltransferase
MNVNGKIFIVGAGPGDPELLTLKAARLLNQCDVVLYDRLVSREVLKLANPQAELVYVGKHEGEQEHVQREIFKLLYAYAAVGKTVVRLKGGDPLVFGRGAEEWAFAVGHGFPVEFVPGVTSAISIPGLAGIPLTYRHASQSFAVVTGHCKEGTPVCDWSAFTHVDTLVILMGVKNRALIARSLIAAGRRAEEAVAFVEHGSTPREHVVLSNLGEVSEGHVAVENPAVFVVGDVVRLRPKLMANRISSLASS